MRVLRTVAEAREYRTPLKSLALVPTMGAFHEGHLALMRRAGERCPHVAVSIFVNPLQFGPGEDFDRYPRREAEDIAMAASVGVEAVFVPEAEELVGSSATEVRVLDVSRGFEGDARPGHFEGVATIVLKLLNALQPNVAVFGLKDLQQCAVVSRLVRDLFVPVELDFVEVVRDDSGLALSSRNAFLSDDERLRAASLARTLRSVAADCAAEGRFTQSLRDNALRRLEHFGLAPEYLDAVEPETMRPVEWVGDRTRLVAAVRVGAVRLLDNVPIRISP